MSDLLNQASLVMVPSGYKEDTVYSVVPSDGSGDLAFTRASNGTRVNSAGLVEVCPWNLLEQSEAFDVSPWTKSSGVTISANSVTAPNGTTTADVITFNGSNRDVQQVIAVTNGVFSFYAKGSGTIFVGIASGTQTQTEFTLTADWSRIEVPFTGTSSSVFIGNYGTTATSVTLWGAQLNIGSTAKPYFPTTDRLNVPRLTYQNGGGGCPSLLLEKQSTNLITYSEQIQNAAWNVIGGDLVVTGNAVISPDGTQNAGAITLANSANRYFVHDPFSITGGVAYTYSVWMKSASGNLSINMGGVNGLAGVLKTVTTEWQRFTYTFTQPTTYAEYFGFDQRDTGSSTSGTLYFWGAQVEASSYATSLINTTSSSATRVKDLAYKSGATALIGQTEGVLFCDFNLPSVETSGDYPFIVNMWKDSSNRFGFARYPNGGVHIYMQYGGSAQFTYNTTQLTGRFKLALGYKANDCVIYLNGTLLQTITSATIPATDDIIFNGINTNGDYNTQLQINQTALFKTRLTNAELASITTL